MEGEEIASLMVDGVRAPFTWKERRLHRSWLMVQALRKEGERSGRCLATDGWSR